MLEALIYLASSFWLGAVHAATPGHGKTIAAAYIVGVRGKPVDAWILGIFVTLSHTSGILLVGLLSSLGLPGFMPQRTEAYLALFTGLLVVVIGLWMVWTQRSLIGAARHMRAHAHDGLPAHTHDHAADHTHDHDAAHAHTHDHSHGDGHAHHHHHAGEAGYHTHGFGFKHTHDMDLVTSNRPSIWVLIGLGVAGGLIPDPAALGILLNAIANGKVMLGLGTVIVFSLGFAATLVLVGVVAAKVGPKILDWLAGPWAIRMQLGTSLLIVIVGLVLTYQAWVMLAKLA
jgi:nickel/cobalt transporter (NicO) family protein